MNQLLKLQARIKYSRLYKTDRIERLYIPFGQQTKDIKTSAWFEIVNDQLSVFVRVENVRSENLYDDFEAAQCKAEIEKQFHELIHDCELERRQTPLHERLKDDVVPVYDDSCMRHQVDALRFCCSMKASALYADTGTGKSKIAIDLAISRHEAGQIKKVLVFLPVSTKKNFQNQIDLWCKDYPQIEWKLIGHESTGSGNRAMFEALKFVDSETQIIIDESHMIKNPIAKRSKRIKMICDKTSYKLVMTGTPVTDNVHNLYMQYAVLSPLIIGVRDWKKFEEKYLIMGGHFGDEIVGYKNIDHLMGLLEPYTYQIAKEDCLNLPAKRYFTHTCGLTDEQWEYYIEEKDRLLKIIDRDDFSATDIFQTFTRMQQICSGYILQNGEKITLESNKLDLFINIPNDEKVVVFCKYIFEIDVLVEYFGSEKCAVFTGQNPKDRDAEMSGFVSGNKQYFVATMQSGGTGLNGLQEVCRRVVFFSNSFSYFHRKQSVGRIDRKGQENEMFIHDFRTNANIDDRIMKNLYRKGNLSDEVKKLMNDKTKLKKYIENLYVNEKNTYICNEKLKHMKTEILQGTDKMVYDLIAPFAMSRKVAREFGGYSLFTDETYTWFIVYVEEKMAGFSAVKISKKFVELTSAYVIEDFRHKKIHEKMINIRLLWCKENKYTRIKADCQDSSLKQYVKVGFKEIKSFQNWHKMELNLE